MYAEWYFRIKYSFTQLWQVTCRAVSPWDQPLAKDLYLSQGHAPTLDSLCPMTVRSAKWWGREIKFSTVQGKHVGSTVVSVATA